MQAEAVTAFAQDCQMAGNAEQAVEKTIGQKIYVIRGQRVLLDSDLAAL